VFVGQEELSAKRAELFGDRRAEHEPGITDGQREVGPGHDRAVDPGDLTGHGVAFEEVWSGPLQWRLESRPPMLCVLQFCFRIETRERSKKPPAGAGGLRVACLAGCHVLWV